MLFDLDGTLSDSAAGIVAALEPACRALDVEVPPEATLRRFIGPPLEEGFGRHLGLGPTDRARALAAYREHHVEGGAMLARAPYPGVVALLEQLFAEGRTVAVATAKPAVQAREVVAHLGLGGLVTARFGPGLEGGATKADVIAEACPELGLPPAGAVMVGDREHDVRGAKANEMVAVGVLWGHGSRDELEAAGAVAVVTSCDELAGVLGAGSGLGVPADARAVGGGAPLPGWG